MYHIGIDAGALTKDTTRQYGTYTVTRELITALGSIDTINSYRLFSLEDVPLEVPANFEKIIVRPSSGFMPYNIGIRELLRKDDIFLALNQTIPIFFAGRAIAFSHGLSFLRFPQMYPDSAKKMTRQLSEMAKKADRIITSSVEVSRHFNDLYGVGNKTIAIPFGIPQDFLGTEKKYKKKQTFLYVGMNHQIKNLPLLFKTFRLLADKPKFSRFKLLLVGVGSEKTNIPSDLQSRIMTVAHASSRAQLRQYYAEAECLISASHYESFNLPILESLSQGTQVAATKSAVVPELEKYVHSCEATPEALANSVVDAIEKPKQLSLTGLAEKFNWQKYARKIIELYE